MKNNDKEEEEYEKKKTAGTALLNGGSPVPQPGGRPGGADGICDQDGGRHFVSIIRPMTRTADIQGEARDSLQSPAHGRLL